MRAGYGTALVIVGALLASAPQANGDDAPQHARMACSPAPLLQPGKTQLIERVLARPGAKLASTVGGAGGKIVPAFSVLYVYDRSPDGTALQVGGRSDCHPDGWLPAERTVAWRHTIVAAFANRTDRERALFFETQQPLKALVGLADAGAQAAKLRASAAPSDVAALEPETPVDIAKQFYLLPILDATTVRFASMKPTRLLRVAAVSLHDKPAAAGQPAASSGQPASPDVRRNFRTAVVFVVDATKSTQPYIDRTRQALDQIYAKIERAQLQDRVRFGLIGYRDDPKAVPKIEYLTRVFVDPNKIDSRRAFGDAASGLTASTISSRADPEDGYAGIDAAINGIDWSGFSGRFVVMVTDASSRDPGKLASTGFDAHALQVMAREKQVAIIVMHLLTREGGDADHERGRKQYEELSAFPGRGALYYPVPAGDVKEFGVQVERVGDSLVTLVEAAEAQGGAIPQASPATPSKPAPDKSAPEKIADDIAAIGHAMRLAYIGRLSGSEAPSMFEAWTIDRDYANQAVASMDIRVLLSKAQLSDLEATTSALTAAFEKGQVEPSTLYAQLRSAALTLGRDPNKIGSAANQALNKEILGEYLDGLPYKSRVMAIDQDTWIGMSPGEQQALIDDLAVKSRLYRRMHDDVDKWVKLAENASAEDAVYPVPLDALP